MLRPILPVSKWIYCNILSLIMLRSRLATVNSLRKKQRHDEGVHTCCYYIKLECGIDVNIPRNDNGGE